MSKCIKRMGRKFLVFVGDCSQTGEAIANKPVTPLWVIIGFLDTLLRSYGQVVFCNNPVTGLLVIIALFISGPFAALVGLVATTVAIFTAWLLDQPAEAVRAGVYSYNAVLVGQLTAILLPEMATLDWIFTVVGAIFSVYFTSSFAALFGCISKHPMPALTVPFVLAQILVYLCAMSPGALYLKEPIHLPKNSSMQLYNGLGSLDISEVGVDATNTSIPRALIAATAAAASIPVGSAQERLIPDTLPVSGGDNATLNTTLQSLSNSSNVDIDSLDWGEVFTGVVKSLGQVYGQDHLPASLLMYLGVIISSPTTALMGLFGSIISTLMGALLSPSPAESLNGGLWGFNGLLSAGAVGGFALVLTPQSAALALLAALLTGVLQFALMPSFQRAGVPLLTLPFNLATLLLLCATARGSGSLVRPPALTYPEKHRRDWAAERETRRTKQNKRSASESIPEDENEKREQFRKLEMV